MYTVCFNNWNNETLKNEKVIKHLEEDWENHMMIIKILNKGMKIELKHI